MRYINKPSLAVRFLRACRVIPKPLPNPCRHTVVGKQRFFAIAPWDRPWQFGEKK
jgi:hypothetical protein